MEGAASQFLKDGSKLMAAIREHYGASLNAWDRLTPSNGEMLESALVDLVNATEAMRNHLEADRQASLRGDEDWRVA